jgi:hypothetical protein
MFEKAIYMLINLQFTTIFDRIFSLAYTLNMTSQRWLTDADFSPNSDAKSIWWHYLVSHYIFDLGKFL